MRAGTNSVQKVPSDYCELLHSFRKSVVITRKTKNIRPSDIVNMDKTMCRFDRKGEETIIIKITCVEKKGFTVALAATISGVKLTAVIVFKEQRGSWDIESEVD